MFGERVRELRQARGLTQTALAERAGVSRQLIGAVEAGRHLPRVDAAAALATALDATVEALLADGGADTVPEPVVAGAPNSQGPVRLARVGERLVCAPAPLSWDGWATADGVLTGDGQVRLLGDTPAAAVVVGCDPAIALAARMVDERAGGRLLAVAGSSAAAVTALGDGRSHAAVVHGRSDHLPQPPVTVRRWRLARWQVGLAAPPDTAPDWWRTALSGYAPVIQREAGAGAQAAFERASQENGTAPVPGPRVRGHVEAAWLSEQLGMPAVTIEPAARAARLEFHALETHVTELWVARTWLDEPALRRLGDAVTSEAFARRLGAIGGYDLTDCGTTVEP